jgi:hypothetical protein
LNLGSEKLSGKYILQDAIWSLEDIKNCLIAIELNNYLPLRLKWDSIGWLLPVSIAIR